MRTIGLLGGLGPRATVHYYEQLVRAHDELGAPMNLAMAHVDVNRAMSLVNAGSIGELARYLAGFMQALHAAGAGFAVIPAFTPHICLEPLQPLSPLPILDLLAIATAEIERSGFKRVALFGTRFTIASRLFGRLEPDAVAPMSPEEVDAVHRAYLSIVKPAEPVDAYGILRTVAHSLIDSGRADGVVMAGTELALVFDPANTDFPAVDCARAHISAIVRESQLQ